MEMPAKLKELVDSLTESTRRGDARWRETGETDWYVYGGSTGTVVVGSVNNDGQWPHGIRLLDKRGVEVMSFEEAWVDQSGQRFSAWELNEYGIEEAQPENSLGGLYMAAKDPEVRYAGVLEGLLKDLRVASADLERVPAHA